nr:hypothetical protein Itr_chr03CG00370 [Ipomoea trifida]
MNVVFHWIDGDRDDGGEAGVANLRPIDAGDGAKQTTSAAKLVSQRRPTTDSSDGGGLRSSQIRVCSPHFWKWMASAIVMAVNR